MKEKWISCFMGISCNCDSKSYYLDKNISHIDCDKIVRLNVYSSQVETIKFINCPKLKSVSPLTVPFPKTLESIIVKHYSSLNRIPDVPNLKFKYSLEELFSSTIRHIILNNCLFKGLGNLCNYNLITLDISYTNIKIINNLPKTLTELNCNYCPLLTSIILAESCLIEMFPRIFIELYCNYCPLLTSINNPEFLSRLECCNCLLLTLPLLSNNLIYLDCSNCPLITSLGESLPDYLEELTCDNCPITVIPPLPSFLWFLNCSGCPLLKLPEIPEHLTSVNFSNNRYICSIPKHGNEESLTCYNCPWLPFHYEGTHNPYDPTMGDYINKNYENNIKKLKLLQRVFKKYLFRRTIGLRIILKQLGLYTVLTDKILFLER